MENKTIPQILAVDAERESLEQQFVECWEQTYKDIGTPIYDQVRDAEAKTIDYGYVLRKMYEVANTYPDRTWLEIRRAWFKGKGLHTGKDFTYNILMGWLMHYLPAQGPDPIPPVQPTTPDEDLARFLPHLRNALTEMAHQAHWFASPGCAKVWKAMAAKLPESEVEGIRQMVEDRTCARIGAMTQTMRREGESVADYWTRVTKRLHPREVAMLPSLKIEFRIELTRAYCQNFPEIVTT